MVFFIAFHVVEQWQNFHDNFIGIPAVGNIANSRCEVVVLFTVYSSSVFLANILALLIDAVRVNYFKKSWNQSGRLVQAPAQSALDYVGENQL